MNDDRMLREYDADNVIQQMKDETSDMIAQMRYHMEDEGSGNYYRDKEKGVAFDFFEIDIYRKEKKFILIRAGMILVCSFILLLFSFDKEYDYYVMYIVPLELFATMALLYGLSAPLQLLYLKNKMKRLPQCVKICEESIWIDDERYIYDTLKTIKIISPSKKPFGYTPLNYALYITANGKKMKYWLGSSMSFQGYGQFCDRIIRALNAYPGKLQY